MSVYHKMLALYIFSMVQILGFGILVAITKIEFLVVVGILVFLTITLIIIPSLQCPKCGCRIIIGAFYPPPPEQKTIIPTHCDYCHADLKEKIKP